ncbi:TonB family protein [Acinetobacter sp. AOR15_HL]|uniref:TonB family protein n=1 Tax=unclassified Acinetobacter TaxID=196816 RepID=UPI0022EAA4CF|nr:MULTISPECIES: TonB family protein [unclassified Acinetobacter]MDA3556680.1 TonB family protein [Acinetobacter sp. AOR15_HL]MDA3573328.1 TonB family protein [Acinetobacter sp. AOR14_HL]
MKILLKVLLSLSFCFALNVYASDPNNLVEIMPPNLHWKQIPKINISDQELQGYDREVVVGFLANEKGKVVDTTIIKSSGIESLDKKSLKAMKNASFYPYQENGFYVGFYGKQPFNFDVSRKPIFEVFPEIKVNKDDLKGQIRYMSIYSEADDNGNITVAKIQKSTGLQELDNFVLDEFRKKAKFFPLIINGKSYPISDTTNLTLTNFFTHHY